MILTDDACLNWAKRSGGALAGAFLLGGLSDLSAQVVLDGKFGSAGPIAGPNYNITPEQGAVRGDNLFHSFTQFDLKAGDVAAFSGPANIQNILTRVTGGSASSIDGTIRSEISGANFFLINPQGVIFGANASIDVSGSFALSTADYLKLADDARFVASLDADDSVLSTAPVSAFGFLGNAAAPIAINQGNLQVLEGKTVSLVGGDLSMVGGSVVSAAGDLSLVSVKSAGEVPVDPSTLSSGEFHTRFPQQGRIALADGARLDASGEGGGRIVIRGGSLLVDNSKIEANSIGAGDGRGIDIEVIENFDVFRGGQINSLSPGGFGASGNIAISAGSIQLNGEGLLDDFFNPATQIAASTGDIFGGGGPAKGGDITIRTGSLELANSAQISAATFGAGDAGRIEIDASSVRLDAVDPFAFSPAQITANTQMIEGGGKAGDIIIRTDAFELRNGATILAASFGNGAAGLIDIDAEAINLFTGSIITAGTFGSGPGGNIHIQAASIRIDGTDRLNGGSDFLTGIQAVTTSSDFPAPGGTINIETDFLELDHTGSIFTSSIGSGEGGDVNIDAGSITLANGSNIRAAGEATGSAGELSIYSHGDLILAEGSSINTSAPASSGGNITVRADREIRLVNSQINAQAGLDGGNITVSAGELIYLLNSIFTGQADATDSGFGNGGNLLIGPSSFLILNDGALLSKSSLGNGGNITILSDYFFQSESLIDASAPFGLPGTVIVTAPDVDLSASLISLPGDLLDAASELRPDCAIRLSDGISSFVVLGRGGLPIQPGGFLPSGILPLRDEPK